MLTDCSGKNFICDDQSQVLTRAMYCDGKVDCADSSDEPLACGKSVSNNFNLNICCAR